MNQSNNDLAHITRMLEDVGQEIKSERRLKALRRNTFHQEVTDIFTELKRDADVVFSNLWIRFRKDRWTPRTFPCRVEIKDLGRDAGQAQSGMVVINSQLVDHPDEVRETIAHELAHAIVWGLARGFNTQPILDQHHHTHSALWKETAIALGSTGDAHHSMALIPLSERIPTPERRPVRPLPATVEELLAMRVES
jgi:hypothetical protein